MKPDVQFCPGQNILQSVMTFSYSSVQKIGKNAKKKKERRGKQQYFTLWTFDCQLTVDLLKKSLKSSLQPSIASPPSPLTSLTSDSSLPVFTLKGPSLSLE